MEDASKAADSQKLPFDRQAGTTGISPSQSMIPSAAKLPEGTPIVVRVQDTLSSASAHAGDSFKAIVDEAVAIDGQTLVARGTAASGRVLEAKAFASTHDTGYLRIALVSLSVGGRTVAIETSSIFAKGGAREERKPGAGASPRERGKDKDIVLGGDRRLSFRLAQAVDLQQYP